MFCRSCGNQIEEGWKVCPNCGVELQQSKSVESTYDESANTVPKNRKELKKELVDGAFKEGGNGILFMGAGKISKDLVKILQPGEKAIQFYRAYRNSLLGQLKSLRMFRNYMVCTSQRLIYVETGEGVFSLFPFLRKIISYPYHEVISAEPGKRVGIYSGKIIINSRGSQMNFAMIDSEDAEKLASYLMDKKG